MSMVDPSSLNLTINNWNQSLRRALQIHLPGCSACFCACKGMIIFFATTLERKWPSEIHLHISSPNLDLRLHWILPSTMPAYPLSERKPSNWLLRWMLRWMPWLISSSLAGPMTSRKSHAHCVPTGNIMNHSLLKMDLCSMEKPHHHPSIRKGAGPWYSAPITPRHYQNTVACPWLWFLAWYQQGHWGSCLAMWNMHEISSPECCYATHTNTYTFMPLADMCIGHVHIGWYELPYPCWFLFQGNPGMQPPHRPK